ncbi:helix-turn-helix domain-containing protein [Xanthobacter autotrophicus]|uniref:helix-turn-helix domain-containing protein n=1 Tax=Xanthobacter autotrophicus TaxID=280 RepID=UPI00372C22AA
MDIATWLSQNDVSEAEFAVRIGVTRQSIWRYRSGERVPRPGVIARIREATGGQVTANDFFPQLTNDTTPTPSEDAA